MIATVDEHADDIASVDQETKAKPQIMYDVTYDEWLAFREQPPVNHDDVLDVHMFLRDFDGDFERLFREDTRTEENVR